MKIAAADTVADVVDDDSSAGVVVEVDAGDDRIGDEDALCTADDLPSTSMRYCECQGDFGVDMAAAEVENDMDSVAPEHVVIDVDTDMGMIDNY